MYSERWRKLRKYLKIECDRNRCYFYELTFFGCRRRGPNLDTRYRKKLLHQCCHLKIHKKSKGKEKDKEMKRDLMKVGNLTICFVCNRGLH